MYSLQARATPKAHYDEIVKSLVSNINELEQSGLFESIQVYKRNLVQVYNSKQCIIPNNVPNQLALL